MSTTTPDAAASAESVDYPALLDRAHLIADPTGHAVEAIREHVRDLIRTVPDPDPAAVSLACVDGAVASEQTDSLMWTCAAGVRQAPRLGDRIVQAATVTPVGAETERVRGALMASCEMRAALSTIEADPERVVFMDGGISTPLVSIAQGLSLSADGVADAVHEHYARIGLGTLVRDYVDAVLAGQIAALPKQDTSSGYTGSWAHTLTDRVGERAAHSLENLRDRPVLSQLLAPGEWITPRPALEAARIEAKMLTRDGLRPAKVDADYARIRDNTSLYVTYFKPRRLPDRVIKVEYREHDTASWARARQLLAVLDAATLGPRIKEPLFQHEVDTAAKRAVTSLLSEVMQVATSNLDPALTSHYRTVRT